MGNTLKDTLIIIGLLGILILGVILFVDFLETLTIEHIIRMSVGY